MESKTDSLTGREVWRLLAASRVPWTFAKTMPFWPHYYTVLRDWKHKDQFVPVCRAIHDPTFENNFIEYHKGIKRIRFPANGWVYWSMDDNPEVSTLINKAVITYRTERDRFPESVRGPRAEHLGIELPESGVILEHWCGRGTLIDELNRRSFPPERYVGLDTSKVLIDQLKKEYPRYGDRLYLSRPEHFYSIGEPVLVFDSKEEFHVSG